MTEATPESRIKGLEAQTKSTSDVLEALSTDFVDSHTALSDQFHSLEALVNKRLPAAEEGASYEAISPDGKAKARLSIPLESFEGAVRRAMESVLTDNSMSPEQPHDKLFAALALAQGDISAAEASQENTHFDYKYANLQNCLDACRKPLADNELAVIQLPTVIEGGLVQVTTILGHSSGQSITQVMTMQPDKGGPQAVGSCITYLRRYMLCAMVGIGQQDDDANMATADPDQYEKVQPGQIDEILVLADKLFKKDADGVVDRMLAKVFQVSAVSDIPADHYEQALTLLQNQAKREKDQAKAEKKPAKKPAAKPAKPAENSDG